MPRKRLPARLYQRPDTGEWIIRDGNVTRRTGCGAGERAGAEAALQAYLASRPVARPRGPSHPHQLTVGAVLALYATDKGPNVIGKETLALAVERLAGFWGDLTCDAVRGSTCRAYEAHRATPRPVASGRMSKAGPATVRRELGVLQAALNYAHEEGLLLYPVKATLSAEGEPRDRWLTRDEAARLIRAAAPHLRRFIVLSLYTGRRASAVLGLTWTRADPDAGVIRFKAEGERETKKRKGSARMTRRLSAHVRRWRRLAAPGETHVVMFRGRPVASVKKAMAEAARRAGLSGVTPHVLKHTAVTWAIMRGLSIERASEFFDTTPATIRRHYWHHSPHFQAEAVAAIEGRA